MGASAILLKFAKSREAAYLQYGRLTDPRAKAISKLRNVAEYFSHQSDQVQLKAVKTVKAEVLALLPDEQSRYQKLRERMIQLLESSQSIESHAPSTSKLPTTPHDRSAAATRGAEGTQLNFI